MALFALPILILLMVSAIILLAFKRWKLASAVAVVVLLLNWYWQVCPMHFFHGEESSDKTFRVVTYNIYPQVDSTQYDQWQRDMLEEIKRLHPDILCLQEFKHTDMAWLEEEIAKYMHSVFGAYKIAYFNACREYCEQMRTDWRKVHTRVLHSGYINGTHIYVPGPDGKFSYGGKCFPKNVNAFAQMTKGTPLGTLLEHLHELNVHFRGFEEKI